ncbi:MAG: SIR2 family protein [Rikenellaceae bacterium]
MIDYKDSILELVKRYENGEVSAFIGAGFSKNIFKEFPSWKELLYDMILELFRYEIETDLKLSIHQKLPKVSKDEYYSTKVDEIIEREGYLNIVSKYVEKRGIRESLESYIEERIPRISANGSIISFKGNEYDLSDSDINVHAKLLEGNFDKIYTTNYDKILEATATRLGKEFKVVTKAQDLSMQKLEPAIIKLHGDLCDGADDPFCFDGNIHHRYIISREDYENYPKEHEAFTQLMRISLLQGTFCMFGFSGDDPNFKAWTEWVRDILEVQGKENEVERTKIYLISVENHTIKKDKLLFYTNHNIQCIPLKDPKVKEIIGCESNDERTLVASFFDYLRNHNGGIDRSNEYISLWRELHSIIGNKELSNEARGKVEELTDRINQLQDYSSILRTHNQDSVLFDLIRKQSISSVEANLAVIALEDTMYMLENCLNLSEKIEVVGLSNEYMQRLNFIKERQITLTRPQTKLETIGNDRYIYEDIIRTAFSLDFKLLREKVELWKPQGIYVVKRAVLLAMYDKETSKSTLLRYIDNENDSAKRYYATQLLNFVGGGYGQKQYSTKKYENQSLLSLLKQRDGFVNFIKASEQKVREYGNEKIVYHMGDPRIYDAKRSLQFLQFTIERTVMLNFGYWHLTNDTQWYVVLKNLYEAYPYPMLYYSLLCNDDSTLARIGQDFAYSDKLHKETLPDILKRILAIIVNNDAPSTIVKRAYIIATELFVSVNAELWNDDFMTIWRSLILPNYSDRYAHRVEHKFACRAFPFLTSAHSVNTIVIDLLERSKVSKDATIDYLYHLSVNQDNCIVDDPLKMAISTFISNIDSGDDIIIAGNIYYILSDEEKLLVKNKLIAMLNNSVRFSVNAINSSSYFAAKRAEVKLLKQAILDSQRLWDNGLRESSASPCNYIRLSSLNKDIRWTRQEIKEIYLKLNKSLKELKGSHFFNDRGQMLNIMEYDDLLIEMSRFLNKYKSQLSRRKDYENTCELVSVSFAKLCDFTHINDALISNDSSKMNSALGELYREVKISGIDKHELSISILIDRVLLKNKTGLNNCLDILSYFVSEHYNTENASNVFISKLKLILDSYTLDTLQHLELDVPKNAKRLLKIYNTLETICGFYSDYWHSLQEAKRFNNL